MTASAKKVALSANALTVLERRYLVKGEDGKPVEAPEALFWRVARTIAAPDKTYGASDKAGEGLAGKVFHLMATRGWVAKSPTPINPRPPLRQPAALVG